MDDPQRAVRSLCDLVNDMPTFAKGFFNRCTSANWNISTFSGRAGMGTNLACSTHARKVYRMATQHRGPPARGKALVRDLLLWR